MNTENVNGVAVALPVGRLDFGAAAAFQQQLEHAVAAKPSGLVVDCSGLDYVSSAGLRVFLVAARAAKAAGVGFAVSNLKPAVKEVFDLTGFGNVITLCVDRAAALASVTPAA
jgi:anti-anti-sigma factor